MSKDDYITAIIEVFNEFSITQIRMKLLLSINRAND